MVIVTTSDGKIKGGEVKTNSGYKYYEFLSIPYAKPPVGDLRFKSPQPPEPWGDIRDATRSDANMSCQPDFNTRKIIGSEDCLYLHVYTPNIGDTSQAHLLPVMFNIHGGGFIYGNGFKDQQGPDYLIENNVVIVSINYRVGVLGFLNLEIPDASGNMGLKDQVLALKWVQNNIDKFGGDKNNVTIFGISAGGASVEYLLLSSKAKGLFHKAIQQSGASLNDWAINYEYDDMNKILLEKLEYKGDFSNKAAIYDFLLKVPAEKLVDASFKATETYTQKAVFFGFVPTIEKEFADAFLTKQPFELLKTGNFNKVPVIKGFSEREGLMLTFFKPSSIKQLMFKKDFVEFLSGNFTSEELEKYNKQFSNLYKNDGYEDEDDFAIDFFGDLHFSAGVWVSANLTAKYNLPIYLYEFTYDGDINIGKNLFGVTKKGACHGGESPYLYVNDYITVKPNETDIQVRNLITKMWTNFAKTGDPTANGIPLKWPKFTEENKMFLKIDKELTIDSNHEPEKMALFEEIYQNLAAL